MKTINGILCVCAGICMWSAAEAETLTAGSYAQSGLIGQWDGIENAGAGQHDGNAVYWKDLSGQTGDFALFAGVASFTGNGLHKDAAGIAATNVYASLRTGVKTMEVVVSGIPSSGWVNALFLRPNETVSINNSADSGKRGYFFDNSSTAHGWLTTVKRDQETVTVLLNGGSDAATNCYMNGAMPTVGTAYKNSWGAASYATMHIGGRTGFTGSGDAKTYGYTVHAIRLYNRALSAAEIARNASIDQVRFFGASESAVSGNNFAVSATAGAGGLVSADDVNAAPASTACSALMAYNATVPVALRAVPLPGWKFAGWEGDFSCVTDGSASTPVIAVTPTCAIGYRATFERDAQRIGCDYIADGLVGYWDGIENAGEGVHDASSARWVDLTGNGGDFVVNASAASFGDAGLAKTGSGMAATNVITHSGVMTIESAVSKVQLDSGKWLNAAYLGYHQTMSFRNESGGIRQFFFDYDNLKWQMAVRDPELTMSVTYAIVDGVPKGQHFYYNGAEPPGEYGGNSMYWGGTAQSYACIGGRPGYASSGDATATNYTVNALRFYNRALAPGEVAYNSAVDRRRFRGMRAEAFAYRLAGSVVQCQLRAWMDGTGGTVKVNSGTPATDCVATEWVTFGTEQTATFTAQPDDGWTFLGWAGDVDAIVSGTAGDLSVGVSSNGGVALQAVFTQTGKYAQNGLIGFWDAKENAGFGRFDASAAAWKDLTGISGDFVVNSVCGVFEANAFHKVCEGRMAFNPLRRTDVRTIEVVVSDLPVSTSLWTMPIFVSRSQHVSLKDQGEGKDRMFFFDYNHFGLATSERPSEITVSLLCESEASANRVYVNGAELTGTSSPNSWGDTAGGMMTMGGRAGMKAGSDDKAFGYRIHAVRFYDRQLTPAEIRRNAHRDGMRYFGRQSPGIVLTVD